MKTLEKVTLKNRGQVAVVQVTPAGIVEVDRDGIVTEFQKHHTLETVIDTFEMRGWEAIDSKLVRSARKQGVPFKVQEEVDEYLEIHAKMAELKAQADSLKKNIKGYMEDNNIQYIRGSEGKKVELQEAYASNSTSRYTDYELASVQQVLEGSLLRQVTEIRVNAEKLDGVLKTSRLPKHKVDEVKALKIQREGTCRFVVKQN